MTNDNYQICMMALQGVFKNAVILRAQMAKSELLLWEYLRSNPLGFKFKRQHPMASYILDFYCHRRRLSIEIDGKNHRLVEQKMKDSERTKYLISIGIIELRFNNDEVIYDIHSVIIKINKALSTDSPLGAGVSDGKNNQES